MVLEEKKIKNICNFYVSEYHLEIMLLPYISNKIDNKEKISVITEKDLRETINVVIDKINLEHNKKEMIKSIGWNNQNIENIHENSNIILIGSQEFINSVTFKIKEKNKENIRIIACYDYNEIKDNMQDIANKYDGVLNTLGIKNLK